MCNTLSAFEGKWEIGEEAEVTWKKLHLQHFDNGGEGATFDSATSAHE